VADRIQVGAAQQRQAPGSGDVAQGYSLVTWIKQTWSTAHWAPMPYLCPIASEITCFPELGTATFRYDFGDISREDAPSFQRYAAYAKHDAYVVIQIVPMAAGLDPWVSFVGVLPSESLHILGSPEIDLDKVPSGYQTCQAYSLEYLLQKRRLIGSRCMEQGLTPQDVVTIDRQLPFNRRSFQGIRPLGNRSKVREKDIGDNDLTFIFGAEAIEGGIPRWRARDILEYVLANSHLGDVEGIEPLFVLGGPDDPDDPNPEVDVLAMLEGIYPVIDQGHRTALEIISEIVTRRRGLSAYVKWTPIAAPGMEQGLPEAGSDVELYVCSMTDIVGEVAGKTMPKNAEVYDCNLEEGIDIGEAILEEDGINRQDRIVVYGRPVLTCFSAASPVLISRRLCKSR